MKENVKHGFLVSLLLIGAALVIVGCGKKGPPVAPRYEMPSPATDLKGEVQGDALTLTWTVPEKSKGINGFIVYRSKTSLSEPECTTCPVLFERVMDIPIVEKDPEDMEDRTMTYSEALEKGFRYMYKVNPYMEGGLIGKDSNLYVIKFESEQDEGDE